MSAKRPPSSRTRLLAGMPSTRTLTEAYEALGLPEGSSYDEVLAAKNRLLEGAGNNMERKMEVRGRMGGRCIGTTCTAQAQTITSAASGQGRLPLASNVV